MLCWHVVPPRITQFSACTQSLLSGCVLAVVEFDPDIGTDVESRLYSEYVRSWWPDPTETPAKLKSEMATLCISLHGSVLRYSQYNDAWRLGSTADPTRCGLVVGMSPTNRVITQVMVPSTFL